MNNRNSTRKLIGKAIFVLSPNENFDIASINSNDDDKLPISKRSDGWYNKFSRRSDSVFKRK